MLIDDKIVVSCHGSLLLQRQHRQKRFFYINADVFIRDDTDNTLSVFIQISCTGYVWAQVALVLKWQIPSYWSQNIATCLFMKLWWQFLSEIDILKCVFVPYKARLKARYLTLTLQVPMHLVHIPNLFLVTSESGDGLVPDDIWPSVKTVLTELLRMVSSESL